MNSLIHGYPQNTVGNFGFEVTKQGELIVIRYHDDGCGISTDNLSKIFDPFFTTKRNQGGTGLGLHIVYNLVTQKLRGSIDVNSQVGVGTEFVITIPIQI
jgi:signal transduction histidine kinase